MKKFKSLRSELVRARDPEIAKLIVSGMMEADLAILSKGLGKQTPEVQKEMIRLYKKAIKAVTKEGRARQLKKNWVEESLAQGEKDAREMWEATRHTFSMPDNNRRY